MCCKVTGMFLHAPHTKYGARLPLCMSEGCTGRAHIKNTGEKKILWTPSYSFNDTMAANLHLKEVLTLGWQPITSCAVQWNLEGDIVASSILTRLMYYYNFVLMKISKLRSWTHHDTVACSFPAITASCHHKSAVRRHVYGTFVFCTLCHNVNDSMVAYQE